MGLDMYLNRKIYIRNYGENPDQITIIRHDRPNTINPSRISEVVEEVGYWRKANAIHNWFVKNVQNGKDDCGTYSVDADQLNELAKACQIVLDKPVKAKELLPTTSGFFFGGTEYDEYYIGQISDTLKICKEALDIIEKDPMCSFYYHSSW